MRAAARTCASNTRTDNAPAPIAPGNPVISVHPWHRALGCAEVLRRRAFGRRKIASQGPKDTGDLRLCAHRAPRSLSYTSSDLMAVWATAGGPGGLVSWPAPCPRSGRWARDARGPARFTRAPGRGGADGFLPAGGPRRALCPTAMRGGLNGSPGQGWRGSAPRRIAARDHARRSVRAAIYLRDFFIELSALRPDSLALTRPRGTHIARAERDPLPALGDHSRRSAPGRALSLRARLTCALVPAPGVARRSV
jgi:hypothetical protein